MASAVARRGIAAVLVAVVGATSSTACGDVRLKAPRVTVLATESQLVFAGPRDRMNVVGGETVLTVTNDSSATRRLVLARIDAESPDDLPRELRRIERERDDDRVVGITAELDAKEATFAGGGLGYVRESHTFHVYLDPKARYVLFDAEGGPGSDGVFMRLVPSSKGAR